MDAALISENKTAETILGFLRRLVPASLLRLFRPPYHFALSLLAALYYRFPSRRLIVVGVTGTKGKTTAVELLGDILRQAGKTAATLSGLRYTIAGQSWPNLLKMTLPGRFKLQKFLRAAADRNIEYVVLEMTSEGIAQHRHRFIHFQVAAITNLQKEHLEAHGSFEAYREAKAQFFRAAKDIHVINQDDPDLEYFWQIPAKQKIPYLRAERYIPAHDGAMFTVEGKNFATHLIGEFNLLNILCVMTIARALDIDWDTIKKGVANFPGVPGRLEFIQREPFAVIVDYAHTPDSLLAVYKTIESVINPARLICVFGAAGGGRDKWKRPVIGEIAAKYCDEIILTNEDPYDESPEAILDEIAAGISGKDFQKIIDRKEAIQRAIPLAKPGDTVIITGKGAEKWMVLAGGKKVPWDDRQVVKEFL